MAAERMTRDRFEQTLGALNPVGHIIIALPSDQAASDAREALPNDSFSEADVLSFSSRELEPRLNEMLRAASGAAGFGYESTLMRRYLALAQENVGWLVVYAPDDKTAEQAAAVAKRFEAKCAVRYHSLASEDLI